MNAGLIVIESSLVLKDSSLYLWINCRKPQLCVTEKVLRFAQRQLESSQSNSCSCALQGSIAVDQGRHELSARILILLFLVPKRAVFLSLTWFTFKLWKMKFFGRKLMYRQITCFPFTIKIGGDPNYSYILGI